MNTNVGEMRYRCPGAECIGSASIANYKLAFRTHADIEESQGSEIKGVVWQITDAASATTFSAIKLVGLTDATLTSADLA